MAEEVKGKRFSQRAGWFLDKITGDQWAQQTQQTQQQTSGQQSTGGVFLPWISNNQNLINSNKVSMNNWFTQWIQDWTIKSNIVLPWITNKPNEATLDTTTMKQKRQSYIYAKNNNINTKSIDEQIEEERTWSNKVLGQTGKILKTYREAPINNFKKRWMRAIADSWLPWYFVDKTLEKAWAPDGLGDSIKDAVNETARKVALTYQNKVNEDFQKKVDKNIDAKIREKYDNESITDLIWKWDGAWARYKIWKWTVENWNMIPEIWLMFVNPYVWLTAMWTDVYIQENQGTFEDMLQNWATYEQAKNGAVAVWILNAWIELFMERFLWWAKWAWATALRRLFLKNAQREVVKQATKKWMAEIFARWVSERLKGSMVEWFEEVLQQITGNIMVKLINPDRDILDWARESFEWWFYNLFNWIWWATNIANEFKQNEQIQRNADIEALKYVAEWEQRKAQRMAREKARARFLERVKNPTMDNGYTPTPEQAQQRAREKEENEQFEDELRAEQNRENSKYQETEWENSWLSNSNDYSTDTTISKDYSHSDMVNTDSFFKTDENWQYIDFNWWKLYAWETVSDTESQWLKWKYNKSMFSWVESFSRNPIYEEYRQNFYDFLKSLSNRITKKTEKEVKLWKTKTWADMKLTRKQLRHIIKLHGAFSLNDFLETINNPTYSRLQKWGNIYSDWPFYIKQRPNSDKFYYLWFKKNTDWSYNINTFYEITKSDAEWLLNRKLQNSDYQKYQLKYEEEWYTPWVARKDEKNISWKSGKMLKDFLKWQTIEELAKKYWVERIDVVKWLVDGMAYGSYSNRILRLAEEIKESTAPHELLHLVFDMVDPETKTYLISQVMQSEWWSAEKAEEWLADSFSNFYRTGKIESAPKSTWGKIKIFFKRVRSFINGMWKWRNQLEQMFTDIIESSGIEELQGKIDSNKEINKSKAKMRKRFLEYRRNAEKTQAESTRKTPENWEKNVSKKQIADESVYELQPLERIEQMEKLILDEYGTTDNPTRVAFIDNKWRWINGNMGWYGDYRDTDHREIAQTAFDDTDIEFNNATDGLVALQAQTWLVRVNLSDGYMNIDTVYELMPSQKEWLMRFDDEDIKEVYVDITHPQTWKIIESETFASVRDAVRWIDRHFADSGNKYQKVEREDDRMIALHNISLEKLAKAKDLWWLVAPSIGITKSWIPFENYWEISFIANKDLVSPSKDVIVWETDLYTPRVPQPTLEWKDNVNREKQEEIAKKVWMEMWELYDYVTWYSQSHWERMYPNLAKEIAPYINKTLFKWFTEMWDRIYQPYTMKNILNDMFNKWDVGEESAMFQWNLSEAMARLSSDVKDLENVRWKINTREWLDKEYDALSDKYTDLWWDILEWREGMAIFSENIRKSNKDIVAELADFDIEVTEKQVQELKDIVMEALKLPKSYVEAKIKRWVGFDEFSAVVVPEDKVAEVRDLIWDEIEIFWYKPWDRMNVINEVADRKDVKFQRVYHWSPAEFDRFDSSHMWEWEWAQAHGWGHYVAVDPKTGRNYASQRYYNNEVEILWKTIRDQEDLWDVPYAKRELYRDIFTAFAMDTYDFENDVKDIIERKRKDYKDTINYYETLIRDKRPQLWVAKSKTKEINEERKKLVEQYKEVLEDIEELNPEDIQVRPTSKKRNFYEIEIPDRVKADTPTWVNYLDEEVPIFSNEARKFEDAMKWKTRKYIPDFVEEIVRYSNNAELNGGKLYRELVIFLWSAEKASKMLKAIWYDGIHYFWGRDGEAYVIFDDNDLEIKNHEKYQKVEYEYDKNGNRKWIKFEEDNGEFDPSIFWEPTREEQIADDKENEKNNPFYNAWIKYNNQNYKDDQLTFEEFIQWISERWDKEQAEYNKKLSDISEAQNDPQLLDLQLRAVKLMEEEWNVGKKFWKNVSKEVRDRQQKEVESKREQLISDIVDYMYPWLKTEEITYDMQKEADQKEAEREMLGREDIEEKLKYFKKDKNWNREAKEVKIENPDIKLDKILSAWKFEEIFTPLDRVIEWRTPQWQHGVIDNQKNPKQYKSVMEKINAGKTKTKVTLKDVTRDYRALEKYKADQEAEKARKKKERDEAYAKKKQEEYKKIVRMKAFQRLVDMQRFEKYPFLTEEEIKNRYGFTDEEWKKITEQEEIKLPKKRWEKAISDLNKAVDSQVKALIEWLSWQNNLKRKDAEKNLWEIWEIDVDILLGRDEEKWQKEVEEFEKLAKDKGEDTTKKRLKEAQENIMDVEIDKDRENSKSERERIDKLIKSTKTDKTVRWSVKKFTSDIITPVSTKIKEISPKIYREVMRYFQNKDILTNQRLKNIDPFLKALGKIKKENPVRFMDVRVALANRNIWYANWLLKEYGVTVPTKLLDEIYVEADDVGLNINYLWSYYPLSVKAPKSFLEELMKVDKWDIASEIEKRIQKESQKKWWPLEESEITAIINDVIAWWDKWPDINTWNKHLKKRNTEIKRTPKMLEYCDDPISTLITYIEWMTQSIERAKFLWKSRSWNVHTLADYVYNAKNWLTPDQQDDLMDLLKAVFNDESPNKFVQTWRDLGTLTTLWSPSSTLTQLWDLSFSVYENGWKEALKAVWDVFSDKKVFNLEDMWVINRWEEYTNINSQKNLLQKAIHNVFKLTFFSNFDTFWKSTFIQSTWNKRRKRSLKWERGDSQLRKDIMKWADDEYMTDKIIEDLRKWVFSQDVALVMYMKLWNIQPLTKAQMPKAYLNNPNWRLFYQFKTFGIKQLDYVLQETKENTKNFKNLSTMDKMLKIAQIANMVFIMTLLWVWADELKDITMRRRSNSLILRWLFWENVWSEQIWEKMEDNVLKLFWLSRYTIMQMKNDPVDAITSLFTTLPATNLVNYPFKDIYKAFKDWSINWRNPASYQLIPVVWKYRYWIYWWWQDKQQQALDKENKKSTKKKSSWSTRKPLKR